MTEVDVLVEVGDRAVSAAALERAVRHTLSHHEVTEGEISLTLLGDDEIQALNREHLSHDNPTDVLSFALWSEGEPVVGDIYLGYDQAGRHAREANVPLEEELLRLAIHGTLHVLGHDHPEEAEARGASPMYQLQEALLQVLLRG